VKQIVQPVRLLANAPNPQEAPVKTEKSILLLFISFVC
jgi:hypothetical protein